MVLKDQKLEQLKNNFNIKMQKFTENTPPRLENFTSFRDNQDSVYSVAKLFTDHSQNLTVHPV
jgi:hypothetical protein